MKSNERLVFHVARRYAGRGLDMQVHNHQQQCALTSESCLGIRILGIYAGSSLGMQVRNHQLQCAFAPSRVHVQGLGDMRQLRLGHALRNQVSSSRSPGLAWLAFCCVQALNIERV